MTFVVNSTGDDNDANPGDGICSTVPNPTPAICTLRAAIEEANARRSNDTVAFNIAADASGCAGTKCTITPDTLLPVITADHFKLAGGTQPGSVPGDLFGTPKLVPEPHITISGSTISAGNATGSFLTGISTSADYTIIRDIRVIDFTGAYTAGIFSGNATGTVITGCIVEGNVMGIEFQSVTSGVIGGAAEASPNVCINQRIDGIHDEHSTATLTQRNWIGLDPTTETAAGNEDGDFHQYCANCISDGNLASGNRHGGVSYSDSTGVVIRNNICGLNRDGTAAVPGSDGGGITLTNTSNSTIDSNIASGNAVQGILIQGASVGNSIVNNIVGFGANGVTEICNGNSQIDDSGAGTVISGNTVAACPPIMGCLDFNSAIGFTCADYPVAHAVMSQDLCDTLTSTCNGGSDAGSHCSSDGDCPDGTCTIPGRVCSGGANASNACSVDADCPDGTCEISCLHYYAGSLCDPESLAGACAPSGLTATPTALPCLDDVDGSGRPPDVATDIVYIARRLLGLSPVPASFRLLAPSIPDDIAIEATIDPSRSSFDVDENGDLDVATDVVYIARRLLGLAPVPESFRAIAPTILPNSVIARNVDALCPATP